jgi:hypothetical protein
MSKQNQKEFWNSRELAELLRRQQAMFRRTEKPEKRSQEILESECTTPKLRRTLTSDQSS